MSADRFYTCLPFTLAQEAPDSSDWSNLKNFSDDAHDPGGETMNGIIQREYDTFRKSEGLPTQDVRKITQDEGDTIYEDSYWLPYCPKLPAGLDLSFFDSAVNEGTTEAVKILQFSLGVASDGDWGPLTDAGVTAIKDVPAAIKAFTARREAVYRLFNGFQYFGTDWERRSAEIGAEALKMAAVPTPAAAAPGEA